MRSWDPLEVPKRMDVELASAASLQPFRSADACRDISYSNFACLLSDVALRLRGWGAATSEFIYLCLLFI